MTNATAERKKSEDKGMGKRVNARGANFSLEEKMWIRTKVNGGC